MKDVAQAIIDWTRIDTILLDMDGTLLDLGFDNFFWRVSVCDDGTFDVSGSDDELTRRTQTFKYLHSAKAFCELAEAVNVSESSGVLEGG